MQTLTVIINDPMGLHARPAGQLVKEAGKYASKITLCRGEKAAEATHLMALMSLGIRAGEEITVTVSGADEETAANAVSAFFAENF